MKFVTVRKHYEEVLQSDGSERIELIYARWQLGVVSFTWLGDKDLWRPRNKSWYLKIGRLEVTWNSTF